MPLTVVPGIEVERAGIATPDAVAEGYGPESRDHNGATQLVIERAEESACRLIEGVDPAVAEVADEQRAGKRAEAGGRNRQTPGRIERAVGNQTTQEVTVRIELANESIAWTRQVPTRGWIYLRIGDVESAGEVLDVVRREIRRESRVGEGSGQRGERKAVVVHVNLSVGKVRRIEEGRHTVAT